MTLSRDILGVDVAKDWIDVFVLSTGSCQRVAATEAALGRFAEAAAGAFVVFEASGGYKRPLAAALARARRSISR